MKSDQMGCSDLKLTLTGMVTDEYLPVDDSQCIYETQALNC